MTSPLSAMKGRVRALQEHVIDEWREGWRFWSVRIQALAVAAGTVFAALPNELAQIWASLPPELRAAMPPAVVRWLPILLGLSAIAARFLKQSASRHD